MNNPWNEDLNKKSNTKNDNQPQVVWGYECPALEQRVLFLAVPLNTIVELNEGPISVHYKAIIELINKKIKKL